jgi:hypothetical protein
MGALGIGTLLVTFAILVFAEITPKVIGAAHADRLARILGLPDLATAAGRLSGGLVRQSLSSKALLWLSAPEAESRRGEPRT